MDSLAQQANEARRILSEITRPERYYAPPPIRIQDPYEHARVVGHYDHYHEPENPYEPEPAGFPYGVGMDYRGPQPGPPEPLATLRRLGATITTTGARQIFTSEESDRISFVPSYGERRAEVQLRMDVRYAPLILSSNPVCEVEGELRPVGVPGTEGRPVLGRVTRLTEVGCERTPGGHSYHLVRVTIVLAGGIQEDQSYPKEEECKRRYGSLTTTFKRRTPVRHYHRRRQQDYAARRRARKLLRRMVTEKQWGYFIKNGMLPVETESCYYWLSKEQVGGVRVQVKRSVSGFIRSKVASMWGYLGLGSQYAIGGSQVVKLCIHTPRGFAPEDMILSQKLAIEFDEERFWKIANFA